MDLSSQAPGTSSQSGFAPISQTAFAPISQTAFAPFSAYAVPELVAGVDEAGRGPLAGPVVAAAVIFEPSRRIEGLRDSKRLTAKRRRELTTLIRRRARAYALGYASVEEIDRLNILVASHLAMQRAVDALAVQPHLVYVDGHLLPHLPMPAVAVVKGDDRVPEISAASIIAKNARDLDMEDMARLHPGYGFERHKGYCTTEHLAALRELGPCEVHRGSFAPVRRLREMRPRLWVQPA